MISAEAYDKLLSVATGIKDPADLSYLWRVRERIFNLKGMFSVREGFGRKEDVFPKRL